MYKFRYISLRCKTKTLGTLSTVYNQVVILRNCQVRHSSRPPQNGNRVPWVGERDARGFGKDWFGGWRQARGSNVPIGYAFRGIFVHAGSLCRGLKQWEVSSGHSCVLRATYWVHVSFDVKAGMMIYVSDAFGWRVCDWFSFWDRKGSFSLDTSLLMYIDICIYMCVYACIYIYIYTYIHTYIHIYIYIYICVYTYQFCLKDKGV